LKTTLYTVIALVAFAANSLLCRMALAGGYIDAWNFTVLRLLSAAVCLAGIVLIYDAKVKRNAVDVSLYSNETGSWRSGISLLIYALCFSVAYLELDTGSGALILFSAVQLTMIGWGIYNKERLSTVQWIAFVVAFAGFVYLILPSATMPSLFGAALMATSGIAWGIYSIRGTACVSPLRTTTFNFIRSLVALPVLLLIGVSHINSVSLIGLLLACVSGALASGVGYSVWYLAMPRLKSTQAAIVQLSVPVLAAIAGVVVLAEPISLDFLVASTVILGAVMVFILSKKRNA
jgi:drug/metabolite transporter (DMT)-like permease